MQCLKSGNVIHSNGEVFKTSRSYYLRIYGDTQTITVELGIDFPMSTKVIDYPCTLLLSNLGYEKGDTLYFCETAFFFDIEKRNNNKAYTPEVLSKYSSYSIAECSMHVGPSGYKRMKLH